MNKSSKKILLLMLGGIFSFFGVFLLIGRLLYEFVISTKSKINLLELSDRIGFQSEKGKSLTPIEEKIIAVKKESMTEFNSFLEKINHERIFINSFDNINLSALKYETNPLSKKWIIALHGYNDSAKNVVISSRVLEFSKLGYNILAPDLRGYGESDGNYTGFSLVDSKDLIYWINFLVSLHPDCEIVLHGISMGAATVMTVSDKELPSNIKCIVEDCGFTRATSEFRHSLKYFFRVPYIFPFIPALSFITKIKSHYSLYDANPIEYVKKSKLPIFFIHGGSDGFIPPTMAYELYNVCPTKKQILIIEGADHANSFFADRDKYLIEFENFVKNILQ